MSKQGGFFEGVGRASVGAGRVSEALRGSCERVQRASKTAEGLRESKKGSIGHTASVHGISYSAIFSAY